MSRLIVRSGRPAARAIANPASTSVSNRADSSGPARTRSSRRSSTPGSPSRARFQDFSASPEDHHERWAFTVNEEISTRQQQARQISEARPEAVSRLPDTTSQPANPEVSA
jgi:hypothetical protein